MSEHRDEVTDLEAPAPEAHEPVVVLPDDLEAPETDALEQHQPVPVDDEDWR